MKLPLVSRSRLDAVATELQRKLGKTRQEVEKLRQKLAAERERTAQLRSKVQVMQCESQTQASQSGTLDGRAIVMTEGIRHQRLVMTGTHEACVRLFNGQRLFVDTTDRTVGLAIAFDQEWEMYITNILLKNLGEDSDFLDVGANHGYFSIIATSKIKTGRVVAIEPNPQLYSLVTKSMHFNGVAAFATCLNCAVSNQSGPVTLNFNPELAGGGNLHPLPPDQDSSTTSVTIPGKTIDSLVAEQSLANLHLIKMDVEGWEPYAFAGMPQTLARFPHLKLLIEFSQMAYTDAPGFFLDLKKSFKTVSQIAPDGTLTPLKDYDHYLETLWAPWGNLFCQND